MKITAKQIAEIVGVSRGTVDRALHNRGRVDPEVAKRIKEVAKEHGFEPSRTARALALSKNPIKIGAVVPLTKTSFMREVISGLNLAKNELANNGGKLFIEKLPGLDVQEEIDAIDRLLAKGIQGLAIAPVEGDALRSKLKQMRSELDIPIVTFNTDIVGIDRLCFVGMNNRRAGATAAGLMNMLLGQKGGKVLIIMGFVTNQSQSQRVEGFVQEINRSFPNIEILGLQLSMDAEDMAERITLQMLESTPDLAGIMMVPGGQAGVCRALKQARKSGEVKLIVYDVLPETLEGLQEGIIDFVIDQNALIQGKRPPQILFNYLFDQAVPHNELQYTDIILKTRYNI